MTTLWRSVTLWFARRSAPSAPSTCAPGSEQGVPHPEHDAHATVHRDLPPGYTYLRPHRQGGLGTILVVREERSGREVALKRLRDELRHDPHCKGLIEAEARLTAGLQHPNIVPVYDMGVGPDGRFYYTMRLVPGQTLDEYVDSVTGQRSHLPASRTRRRLLDCLRKVCDAMMYAHANGVVHLDLKPSNILVGDFGGVLVVDWGCAAQVKLGSDGALIPPSPRAPDPDEGVPGAGTLNHMAPEQFNEDQGAVGAKVDVYQLGGILHEILTLSPPEVWWLRHASGSDKARSGARLPLAPTVGGLARSVGGPLAAICQRALSSDPDHRYPSVAALAADIDSWFAEAPVSAYREGFIGRLSRIIRGHPQAASLIAVSAVLVVVFNLQLLRVTTQGYAQTLASLVSGQGQAAVGGVSALQGLFESRQQVPDPSDFAALADLYYASYPGINAHSWVPRVEESRRAMFIDEVRASAPSDGSRYGSFTISERNGDGVMVPAASRETYYPVTFIEPYEGNEEALGFDLGSVENRRALLSTARSRRGVSLSELLQLVQADEGQGGLLAAAAVRRPGDPVDRVQGYVTGVFRLEELLAYSWREIDTEYLDVRLYDVTDPTAPTVMWTNERGSEVRMGAKIGPETGLFAMRSELTLFNRRWSVWVRPRPAFLWYYPLSLVRK